MTEHGAAIMFKALADENRVRILYLLSEREMSASDLLEEMDIVQSTLSHHMKILCESGMVSAEMEGKWTYYTVNREVVEEASSLLADLSRNARGAITRQDARARAEWNHLVSFID